MGASVGAAFDRSARVRVVAGAIWSVGAAFIPPIVVTLYGLYDEPRARS